MGLWRNVFRKSKWQEKVFFMIVILFVGTVMILNLKPEYFENQMQINSGFRRSLSTSRYNMFNINEMFDLEKIMNVSNVSKPLTPNSYCLDQLNYERQIFLKVGFNRSENPLHPIMYFPPEVNITEAERQRILRLLPEGFRHTNSRKDRVYEQLEHVPSTYHPGNVTDNTTDVKVVYIWYQEQWKNVPTGLEFFKDCKVNRCFLTHKRSAESTADAIVFANSGHLPPTPPFQKSSTKQIAILNINESPDRSRSMTGYRNFFNWTNTYRMDSTLYDPYFKIGHECRTPPVIPAPGRNFAEGRTKKVAWMVSNCHIVQSGRHQYAKELAKHIQVDIYGACGTLSCPASKHRECVEMTKRDYKFYLSFENHKCEDYITEKVMNAYDAELIPIVLGARREDYAQTLPKHSYIHVEDFESPKQLGEYLNKLDKNDTLYNEYFKWKQTGLKLIDDDNWCRVCALLHEKSLPVMWYDDIQQWWKPQGVCNGAKPWK